MGVLSWKGTLDCERGTPGCYKWPRHSTPNWCGTEYHIKFVSPMMVLPVCVSVSTEPASEVNCLPMVPFCWACLRKQGACWVPHLRLPVEIGLGFLWRGSLWSRGIFFPSGMRWAISILALDYHFCLCIFFMKTIQLLLRYLLSLLLLYIHKDNFNGMLPIVCIIFIVVCILTCASL